MHPDDCDSDIKVILAREENGYLLGLWDKLDHRAQMKLTSSFNEISVNISIKLMTICKFISKSSYRTASLGDAAQNKTTYYLYR